MINTFTQHCFACGMPTAHTDFGQGLECHDCNKRDFEKWQEEVKLQEDAFRLAQSYGSEAAEYMEISTEDCIKFHDTTPGIATFHAVEQAVRAAHNYNIYMKGIAA